MLTLLINESNPLDGLFANSTTGGVGTVPDITVADAGQAVSVQSFTRAGGIITDSFVAGDALHIGIGDGVNAPVCYVALSSASPATGTMPINTAGMVALFAATVANQLSLTLAVVRTRGAYTNTIFSAPIVIRRSAINISTAVPTPSILGTGVSAALQVAINTALGFVRLDASARYPALDGSQITNLAGGSLTVGTTAIASGTTTRVLYDNAGVLGEYTISGTGSVAMTTSPSLTTPTIGDGTESAPSLSFTSDTNTGVYRPATDTVGIVGGGNDVVRMTGIASATDYIEIKNGIGVGSPLHVLAEGASANIGVHLQPKGSGLFTISDGTDFNKGIRFRSSSSAASAITLLDAVASAGRVVTLPDATGTLALVSGDLGTPSALVGTNITGTASGLTAGNATLAATVTVANEATDTTCFPLFATAATGSLAALSNAGLTFNSATGLLSATGLAGAFNGTLGATTPSTVAGTTGTFDSTVTVGANSTAGTLNVKNSSGTTTASISGVDGSASFANGSLTIASDGYTISSVGIKAANGLVSIGNTDGTAAWINGDGSASFASGACTINGSGYAGAGSGLTTLNASNVSSGTLAADRGGTGVSNTGTITLGGNLVTTGAFNTTFAQAATTTVTLPATSATMARTDAAQTFTGVQSMTSPAITTSITTPSTTFALVNSTATTVNFAGAGTTVTIGASTGTCTINNATVLVSGNITFPSTAKNIGDTTNFANKIYSNEYIFRDDNGFKFSKSSATIAAIYTAANLYTNAVLGLGDTGTTGVKLSKVSDGVLQLAGQTLAFSRICLGGSTSSFAGIQCSTTAITFGLADGTAGGSVTCSGTLAVTGATTLTGNLTSNGAYISTPQALSGNGAVAAVNLTTEVTTIANTGTANTTTTLAAGTNGQKKVISFITDGGFDAVITVTNPAWGGAGTITMNDALDNIELRYLNSVWQVFINNGCTLA